MLKFSYPQINQCIDDIVNIGEQSFNHFYSKEKILERLNNKEYWTILSNNDKIPVGFQISYKEEYGKYLWLLGVHPSFQNRGIASKLIELQERISKDLAHQKIVVKTHEGHPEAIRLYLKKGFKHFKTIKHYWGNGLDALFFEKF